MPTIYDMVVAREIASYYTNNPSNAIPYLGTVLFPARKQLGLNLAWIRGHNGLPVALKPSAFDTKATVRDRIGVSKVETEMPFFRESMRIGEQDRQLLNMAAAGANQALMDPIITRIFDDANNLVAGAEVQAERMRMQLLSSGTINVVDNRMEAYEYDYKMSADHKETLLTTERWSQTETATPVADILRWMDKIEEDTGVRPKRVICTRKTWGYLLENKSIRLDMNPIGGANLIMTDDLLARYLLSKLELTVQVYSKKFQTAVGGAAQPFFPDDVFTLIPEGNLGSTWYGTTPEESDLLTGSTNAEVAIVNTGVAITTIKEPHPVNVETIVSAIVLPSFESIASIFIATVHS